MGNKSSLATIVAHIDQPIITPGSVVTGTIYLDVNHVEVTCKAINSRLVGQEHTEVHYAEKVKEGKKLHSVDRVVRARSTFLDMAVNLASFANNTVPRGQFEFPFSFVIPHGSPASMQAGGGLSRDSCKVVYTLECWLDRPGSMRYDTRNKQILIVVNPAPCRSRTSAVIEPTRMPLYSMWCFHRGDVLLGGSVDSCVLSAGQQTTVKYVAKNHSKVRIKAIDISLKEIITIHAHGRRGQMSTNTLYHRRLTPSETSLDLQPCSKVNHNLTSDSLRLLSSVLESEAHQLTVSIPHTARSSYEGSLITVKHVLTIQLITPFGSANPAVYRDIQMHTASAGTNDTDAMHLSSSSGASREAALVEVLPQAPTSLPAGWDPVVAVPVEYPEVRLCAHSAPMLDTFETYESTYNYQSLKNTEC